jgi:phosphoribosylamine--glycine ligase
VIGVCSSERKLADVMENIYHAVSGIYFEGMHYRRDIGAMREEEK